MKFHTCFQAPEKCFKTVHKTVPNLQQKLQYAKLRKIHFSHITRFNLRTKNMAYNLMLTYKCKVSDTVGAEPATVKPKALMTKRDAQCKTNR